MSFKFICPHCDASIKASEAHVGRKVPCPKCGERIVIKAPSNASSEAVLPEVEVATEEVMPEIDVGKKKKSRSSRKSQPATPTIETEIVEQEDSFAEVDSFDEPEYFPEALVSFPEEEEGNPFDAPQAPPSKARTRKVENVHITDIRLPFSSVFRFAVQFFLANLALSIVLGLLITVLALLLGVSLSSLSNE